VGPHASWLLSNARRFFYSHSPVLSGGAATAHFVFFQFSPDPEVAGIQIVDSFHFFLQISLEQHKYWQANFLSDRRHFFHF